MTSIYAAFIENDITPNCSLKMIGHASRLEYSAGVADPLMLNLCLIELEGTKVAIVSLDLFGLDTSFYYFTKKKLQHLGLADNLFLCTTHTHTGPATMNLGSLFPDTTYLKFLQDRIVESLQEAHSHLVPVRLFAFKTHVDGISVNRRLATSAGVDMAPNPEGNNDKTLVGLAVKSVDNKILGFFINFGMHPTTLSTKFRYISPDYPGMIRKKLQSHFGKKVSVLFFQGGCGDVKPNVIDNTGNFRGGTYNDIDWLSSEIISCFLKNFENSKEVIPSKLLIRSIDIDLPLKKLPQKYKYIEYSKNHPLIDNKIQNISSSVMSTEHMIWAETMRDQYAGLPTTIPVRLSLIKLGGIYFLFCPFELLSSLSLKIRNIILSEYLFLSCYTNGNIGYIPSSEDIQEGGYEIETSYKFYHLPVGFKNSVEKILTDAVKKLLF